MDDLCVSAHALCITHTHTNKHKYTHLISGTDELFHITQSKLNKREMYHHKLFMRLFGDEAHFSVTLRVIRNFINGMLNSMRCARVREFGKLNETLIKNVPV